MDNNDLKAFLKTPRACLAMNIMGNYDETNISDEYNVL